MSFIIDKGITITSGTFDHRQSNNANNMDIIDRCRIWKELRDKSNYRYYHL